MAESQKEIQKKWEQRIQRAKDHRESDFDHKFQVEKGRQYFEGIQNPGWPLEEWITINKIYSHMREQLPRLYSIDPYFYVKLKKYYNPNPLEVVMAEQKGKIRGAYLNYLKGELELKKKARLSIQDAHFSFGTIKVHYTADEVENPDAGEPILDDDGDEILDPDTGLPLIEPEFIPINERYNITRVHDEDILWNEDAGPLEDKWSWIAERITLTKEQALKNKWINREALKDAPTKTKKESEKEKKSIFERVFSRPDDEEISPDKEVYIGWEIYDLESREWLMIVEDAPRPIKKPGPLPKGMEKHPYCFLRFVLRDKSPYPIPPISQALDPQKELNMARSRVMTHRKRFNRKYVLFRNAFSDPDNEASKLIYGDDGTVIISDQGNPAQGNPVQPIADAQLDQSSYAEIAALNNDITEMMGSQGERQLPKADSATEAQLIDRRTEIREGDMLSQVVDWISEVARKLDQLVQAHITKDEAVKVAGLSGEFWELVRTVDYDEIAGEFEYTTNVGATMPRLPQIERAQWMAFLNILAGFPHLATNKRLMKHMAELHHIEDEAMLEELRQMAVKIISGQVMPPGGGGSKSGIPESNPITQILGSALGDQGGNVNGGGSASLGEV